LVLQFASPEVGGIKLVKTYTLRRGAYDIAVKHTLTNTSNAAVSPQLYMQLVRDGNKPVGESAFYSTYTGPAVYTAAKKYQKVDFSAIKNARPPTTNTSSTNGYVAMVQHYFASAWILPEGVQRAICRWTPWTLGSLVGRLLLPCHHGGAAGADCRRRDQLR